MFQPIYGTAPDLKDPTWANPTDAICKGHRTGDLIQLPDHQPIDAETMGDRVADKLEKLTV